MPSNTNESGAVYKPPHMRNNLTMTSMQNNLNQSIKSKYIDHKYKVKNNFLL